MCTMLDPRPILSLSLIVSPPWTPSSLLSYFSLACAVLATQTSLGPHPSLSFAALLPCTSLLAPLPVCALGPPSWPAHHPAAVCWCLSYPTPPHHLLHHLGPLDAAQTPPLPFLHCLGPWDPLSSHSLTVSPLDPLFCLLSLTSLLCTS